MNSPGSGKNLLHQIIFRGISKPLAAVVFFSLIINLLMFTVPLYMIQVFDRVLSGSAIETLIFLTLIALAALVVFALVSIARSRILVTVSDWLDTTLSPHAVEKTADCVLMGHPYHSQSITDLSIVRSFVCGAGLLALLDLPWVPIFLGTIFLLYPGLGWVATLGAVAIFALGLLSEVLTSQDLSKANLLNMDNTRRLDASIRNAEAIQAMGMLSNIRQHWEQKNWEVLALQNKASRRAAVLSSLVKFIRLVLQISILGFGAYYVIGKEITPGTMLAANIITARALLPVEQLVGAWKSFVQARKAFGRLQAFFSFPPLRGEGEDLPHPKGDLIIENLTFRFSVEGKMLIQGLTFGVHPGDIVGVMGANSVGKSTLGKLILGVLKPTIGHVRLDGVDVYNWKREEFGTHVGYMPQNVELFSGTVKENICRMGNVDMDKVIEAAKKAGAHQLILRLPDGYDTPIVDNGRNLSGGQLQRIALARAFFGSPKLLVLDEPTTNLDGEGLGAFLGALKIAKEEKIATLIITHDPKVLNFLDKILFLQEGRLKLYGPAREVLQKLQDEMKEKIERFKAHPPQQSEDTL